MAEPSWSSDLVSALPRRVLVAGGAGFIGSAFVRLLLANPSAPQVTVLDKLTYAGNLANLEPVRDHPGYRFVQGDICDRELVDRLGAEVDCIVNFAAETHVDRSILDPDAFIRTDVYGTFALLEAARLHQHQRFLQVSTDEVYGDVEAPSRSVESDPPRPRSPYSASKVGAEMQCFAYYATYGIPILVTRGSNTYGPYQYPEKIVPLFVTQALDGLSMPVYGDGGAVRDYLYVEDHAMGIATVLARGVPGEAYNLGQGGEPIDGMEVAESVLRLTGRSRDLIQHVADRPGHDRRYALDSGKARLLGWLPTMDFARGMEQTVSWYSANRSWWEPIKSGEFLEFYRRNYRPLAGTAAPI
ncbi:MAG TPA: dTDP-glucose 4,6-dehydratase [Candidatus Dormibacteraeota bacterium]|nr:dTDP-glucose 4,6-dehydratase [Candidatus Dormibacteraeota bacterium]